MISICRKSLTLSALALALVGCTSGDKADAPMNILFVGNSYTFARIAPAMQYNAANVKDMTAAYNTVDPTGGNSFPIGTGLPPSPCATPDTGCFEPHPWGGVPGIFKVLADQSGLNYTVSLSTRNAATLRGHFLNTANANWDMRANIAREKWDVVVLQGQSDEPLSPAKSKNGNPVSFKNYANLIEQYVHTGTGVTTTEAEIFGGLANCTAAVTAAVPGPGLSTANCNTSRVIPANTNANPSAKVYLMQTWARPDMVEAHKCTIANKNSLDGAPIVDPTCSATCSAGSNGSAITGLNNLYYTSKATTPENLKDMAADMSAVFYGLAESNKKFAGVVPVGNAFQRAVDVKAVKSSNFYKADGTYDASGSQMNLWWIDSTHASVYGSYLSALVSFGTISGRNPTGFGGNEKAAKDLGISQGDAILLQNIAAETLIASGVALR
ncbi:MAG: hypothetical protein EBR45_03905 [Betaproteobacteria bacterium]|nr:hypothetical protein [Betaproteobacteria bacterium]